IANMLGTWSQQLNTGSALLRIGISVMAASIIGCERSSKRHSAGLRTFVLMSFASSVCMILDVYSMQINPDGTPILCAAAIIAAALMSGKSILFSSRSQIKGLTTSVALWACSVFGFAAGAGLYTLALMVFLFLL